MTSQHCIWIKWSQNILRKQFPHLWSNVGVCVCCLPINFAAVSLGIEGNEVAISRVRVIYKSQLQCLGCGWVTEEMGSNSWQGEKIFLFSTTSRSVLRFILPPIQQTLGALPSEYSGCGTKMITQFYLVLKLKHVRLQFHSLICLHGMVLKQA